MRDDDDPMRYDEIRKEMNLEGVSEADEDGMVDFVDGKFVEVDEGEDEESGDEYAEYHNPMLSEMLKFYKCEEYVPYVQWLMELRAQKEVLGYIPCELEYFDVRCLCIVEHEYGLCMQYQSWQQRKSMPKATT